jgi:hypothetical protein
VPSEVAETLKKSILSEMVSIGVLIQKNPYAENTRKPKVSSFKRKNSSPRRAGRSRRR